MFRMCTLLTQTKHWRLYSGIIQTRTNTHIFLFWWTVLRTNGRASNGPSFSGNCVFLHDGLWEENNRRSDVVTLFFRLRPRTRNFPFKFWVPSVRYFETMYPVVTSDDVFTAKSDKILPLVRIVSRRNVLAPLQRMRVIHRQKTVTTLPIICPRSTKNGAE